ncbi:MAG: MBL fold metallo-hydrolase RNA specificity domain-containing protein [Ilumatobacteraceae bacterium]
MRIVFWGAAGTVTGSRFLVETGRSRILVDCGLFQGGKALRTRNWEEFPVDPATIDAVVLTHAHVDHSGYLPALVRDGFTGPIWCTRATADLCELLLRDSAMLQEEEAFYANRHRTSRHRPALPLFTIDDAEQALEQLQTRMFDHDFPVTDDVSAIFGRVGHILGAASVRLSDGEHSVLFSGDVGRADDPVMRPPDPPRSADLIVTESTYGDRIHDRVDPYDDIATVARTTLGRGGILLIPTFAVGRSQMIMHLLAELRRSERIPNVPIYLNSPMAIDATDLMVKYRSEHTLSEDECSRIFHGVYFTRTVEESRALSAATGPMIILSASGMATGGRVLHHLRQVLPEPKNTVLFVGHQADGTRGHALINGAATVRIYGQDVGVRAEIRHIESLSAHADSIELISWLRSVSESPRQVAIVHGEPDAASALRELITTDLRWPSFIAEHGQSVEL